MQAEDLHGWEATFSLRNVGIRCPISMKTKVAIMVLGLLVLAATCQCLAYMSIGVISPAEAKQCGLVVRARPNGPKEVCVQLEFKAEGRLKDFSHVSLEIGDETGFFGWCALEAKRSDSGSIVVGYFLMSRAFLQKVTLRIVTGTPMDYAGSDVRLADFVDLKNLGAPPTHDKPEPKAVAPAATLAPPTQKTKVRQLEH